MSSFILEACAVEFAYPDGTVALQGVNMAIERGKKIAVLGSNGAGKSTLFLHFNGILRPRRGEIRFAGHKVSYKHKDLLELRKRVGIVFQDPDSQLFSASVYQEISFGPLNLGLAEAEVRRRVEQALAATEISHLRDKPTHALSYGQKKRVSLAAILAMEPEVLICDEPTAWLDPRHSRQVMELLDNISDKGTTVILSTHDVELAYDWADYVYVMQQGRVIGQGTPAEIFLDEKLLQQADLTQPWLVEVYQALRQRGLTNRPLPRNRQELLALVLAQ
ncbi:cobalt/nickel transport system ATP-binding protein [Carboxydocella thermautotrophica]|nr:cobalt/nickel transport system ATP-binding protein [Carboxydocella thermautotrophica]